jgi:glutaredoxin
MMSSDGAAGSGAEIVLYTRPGCPFCTALRWRLRRSGLPVREVDIWDDPDAAAVVRAATGGDETVPTVRIGPVTLVNPGMGQIRSAVAAHAPWLTGRAGGLAGRRRPDRDPRA